MDALEFKNYHVLITGASGGVGKVAVERFLQLGAHVTAQVNTNTASLEAFKCPNLLVVKADLTSEEDVAHLFQEASSAFQPIDILVLNHGIFRSKDIPMADMTLQEWTETLDVNLTGSFLCARGFLRQIKTEKPNICIVGSTAGKYGEAGHADYACSKSALQYGFTLSLKNEIMTRSSGGRVNTVAPGWIETPMAAASMADPETRYKALGTTAMRKIATAKEVVDAILFLTSSMSSHITGQCLMVEGGMEGRVLNKLEDLA